MFLLLSPSTLVGQAFASELQFRRQCFEVCDPEASGLWDVHTLYEQVRRLNPKFIINAALVSEPANGSLNREDKENALRANVLLPQTLARVCQMRNIPWGHVSSGTIYQGAKVLQDSRWLVEIDLQRDEMRHLIHSQPERVMGFSEADEPNHCFLCPPCDFHSGTIALGERAIRGVGNSYTWRPGIFFMDQHHPQNLFTRGDSQPQQAIETRKLQPVLRSPAKRNEKESLSHRPTETPKDRTVPPPRENTDPPIHRPTETPKNRNTETPSPRPLGLPPYFSVTHLGEFVAACLDLWEARAAYGTYHIANPGLVSAKEIGAMIGSSPDAEGAFLPETTRCPSFLLETAKLSALGTELRPAAKALCEAWGNHAEADVRRLK